MPELHAGHLQKCLLILPAANAQARGSPELVQEVQTESDLVSSLLAAVVPLEDVAPVAANSRQCIPEVPVVHVVHRQNRVSLHISPKPVSLSLVLHPRARNH